MITFRVVIRKNKSEKRYIITESAVGSINKVWIANEDGEGGDFDIDSLYDCIDKFFKENF